MFPQASQIYRLSIRLVDEFLTQLQQENSTYIMAHPVHLNSHRANFSERKVATESM